MSKNYWIVLVHNTDNNTMNFPSTGKIFFSRRIPALTQSYAHKRTGRVPHVAKISAEEFKEFVLHKGVLDDYESGGQL